MGPLEYGNQESFCYFRDGILAFKTSLFFLHALSPTVTTPNWQFKALVYQILFSWKRGCFFPVSSHGHGHNHNWIHVQSKVLVCPSPVGKAIHRAVERQDHKRPQRCSSLLLPSLHYRGWFAQCYLVNGRTETRSSARRLCDQMTKYCVFGTNSLGQSCI